MKKCSPDLSLHPFRVAKELSRRHPSIVFEFSTYRYVPRSLFDDRTTFEIRGTEFCEDLVLRLLSTLDDDEDLALHSKVVIKGRTLHIPMIDFDTPKFGAETHDLLRQLLPRKIFHQLVFFWSGNSYHGYSLELLRPTDFSPYLGRLLLLNAPERKPIVDARWIGHRLIGGFTSLRWSRNSPHYKSYPISISPFEADVGGRIIHQDVGEARHDEMRQMTFNH